jgi:nitrite reductase/ring-hydroxylating ferredoxin subunit
MAFTKAATVSELPAGQAKRVAINGRPVALFNVNGNYYALEDVCPHRGAPLSEGVCEGTEVICPWHGARFDLSTGRHLCPPAPHGVASYAVQVTGDEIQIDVP